MRPSARSAGAAFALSLVSVSAGAGASADRWQAMPLWGGYIQVRSAQAPDAIAYAGSQTGAFRLDGDSQSWRRITVGLPEGTVRIVGVDRARRERLFIQIVDASFAILGVFRSDDAGESWQSLKLPGGRPAYVYEVVSDAVQSDRLVAATSDGLFATADDGESWHVLGGSELQDAGMVAVDPDAPSRLLVSTGERTWLSEDSGATFRPVLEVGTMSSFAFDPFHAGIVYGVNGALWRSRDHGRTWQQLDPPTAGRGALSVQLGAAGRVFVGTFRGIVFSDDRGSTWRRPLDRPEFGVGSPPDAVASLAVVSGGPLAAGPRGVWSSTDGDARWRAASLGISGQTVDALTASVHGGVVGLASQGDFFFGDGEIFRFHRIVTDPFAFPTPALIEPSRSDPAVVYAAWPDEGLFRSADGGASWTKLVSPAAPFLSSLAVDPRDSDVVYLGALELSPRDGFDHCFALKSSDGGANWACLTGLYQFDQVLIDPAHAAGLIARQYGTLWRSSDAGITWTALPARGLPRKTDGDPRETSITRFTVDPSEGRRLWVATDDGHFWRSDDAGVNFKPRDRGLPRGQVSQIEVDPHRPSRIVVALSTFYPPGGGGSRPLGLFSSADAGRSWHSLNAGLPPGQRVTTLAADRRIGGRFWAGVSGHGLFRIDLEARSSN